MPKYVGSHAVIAKLPVWATAAIMSTILITVLVGRDIFEGLMYNVSYSSMVGDVALLICVLIGATILQRNPLPCTKFVFLLSGDFHFWILVVSGVLGAIISNITLSSRSGQTMDIFHDVVIFPLFLYLAITLVPVIYYDGSRVEKRAVVCLILVWLVLVAIDTKYDRMNQRRWLHNHISVIEQMK